MHFSSYTTDDSHINVYVYCSEHHNLVAIYSSLLPIFIPTLIQGFHPHFQSELTLLLPQKAIANVIMNPYI